MSAFGRLLPAQDRSSSNASCVPCLAGTFSDSANALSCTPCPANTSAPLRGSRVCIPCAAGRYSSPGASTCAVCDQRCPVSLVHAVVTTVAGSGSSSVVDGMGLAASFKGPTGLNVRPTDGAVLVGDTGGNLIRLVNPLTGLTSSVAGYVSSSSVSWLDGPATASAFNSPRGIAFSTDGALAFIADSQNNRIRVLQHAGASDNSIVSTLAGSGNGVLQNGVGTVAGFNNPFAVAMGPAGAFIVVADQGNCAIRTVTSNGVVSTLAGDGTLGYLDGPGSSARFNHPSGVAVDSSGTVYVSDSDNNCVRAISPGGVFVTTLAGKSGQTGHVNGIGTNSLFGKPYGMVLDHSGSLLIADITNHVIRKVAPHPLREVSTLVGKPTTSGNSDGPGTSASFKAPIDVSETKGGLVYVADRDNNKIRKISGDSCSLTVIAGSGNSGPTNGVGTAASFSYPSGIAYFSFPSLGSGVVVADLFNNAIRIVKEESKDVSTLAGNGNVGASDGQGTLASFAYPLSVSPGTDCFYATDHCRLRRLSLSGLVTTIAGRTDNLGNLWGCSGVDDGAGTQASFHKPRGLAVKTSPNGDTVYITDWNAHTVREVDIASSTVWTILGWPGVSGYVDGSSMVALFDGPRGLSISPSGDTLYVADGNNHAIRTVDTNTYTVGTLSGGGRMGPAWNDAVGTGAYYKYPSHVTTDMSGTSYVVDYGNVCLRSVEASGSTRTLIGGTPTGGVAVDADFYDLTGVLTGISGFDALATHPTTGTQYFVERNMIRALKCGVECPVGSYCPGRLQRFPCPGGTFGNSTGSIAAGCSGPCPVGFFCPAGSIQPTLCPAGSFCPPSSSMATPCPPGSYSFAGKGTCLLCVPGFLAGSPGSGECNDYCPLGTFRKTYGGVNASDCTPCPAGSFSDSLGSALCTMCDAGSFSPHESANSSTACTPCPMGTWSPQGSSLCVPCEAGYYSETRSAKSCTPCPLGRFGANSGGTTLSSACTTCPFGTSTLALASQASTQCVAVAVTCPPGFEAPASPISATTASTPILTNISQCVPLVCPPPLFPASGSLATSTACLGCPPGFFGVPPSCTKCDSGNKSSFCPGLTSAPILNLQQLFLAQPTAAGDAAVATNKARVLVAQASPAVLLSILSDCPLATFQTLTTPGASSTSSSSSSSVTFPFLYIPLLLGAVLISTFLTVVFFLRLTLPSLLSSLLKSADVFDAYHTHEEHHPIHLYKTPLGGFFSVLGHCVLLSYGAFLVAQFLSPANLLVQDTLLVLEDNVWLEGSALPNFAEVPAPWKGTRTTTTTSTGSQSLPLTGIQVRILVSGDAALCGAPLDWTNNGLVAGASLPPIPGGGNHTWTLSGEKVCGGYSGVSLLVFSCPSCALSEASSLTVRLHHSCQSHVMEALAVPAYPSSKLTSLRANTMDLTSGGASSPSRVSSVSWTARVTLTNLADNSDTFGAGKKLSGYMLSTHYLSTATAQLPASSNGFSTLNPASTSVTLSIYLPLNANYKVTSVSQITTLASLIANLLGIMGILSIFGQLHQMTEDFHKHREEKYKNSAASVAPALVVAEEKKYCEEGVHKEQPQIGTQV